MKRWPVHAFALFATLAAAGPETESWRFRVYLDDQEIGTHDFTLEQQGEQRLLRSEAHFKVKVLFLNAYRYDHSAEEHWCGDCLCTLKAQTQDGHKLSRVDAQTINEKLEVTSAENLSLPGCAMSFAYWNPSMLQQSHLLNAQTGKFDAVNIERIGAETIKVRGLTTPAERYHLKSTELQIDLWYTPSGEWLALDSTVAGGRHLHYRLR